MTEPLETADPCPAAGAPAPAGAGAAARAPVPADPEVAARAAAAVDRRAAARVQARLRAELGMPFAPTLFVLLARHRRYLEAALDALLPRAAADAGEHAARALAIAARAATALAREPLAAGGAAGEIAALLARYNEANARSLLICTPMAAGLVTAARVMEAPLPEPPPRKASPPKPSLPEAPLSETPLPAPPGAGALLDDVRACHGGFNLPGLWRELAAGWPRVAERAWALVRAAADEPAFAHARRRLLEQACEATAGWAAPAPADAGCGPREVREIEQILAWYRLVIPTMIVEIECLRRALELGAQASGAGGEALGVGDEPSGVGAAAPAPGGGHGSGAARP